MFSSPYSSKAFGKINDDSWLILGEAVLRRLPLGTTRIRPLDYVDEPGQSIYRIYELAADEKRPEVVNVQAYDNYVRHSERELTYLAGSAGRLTLKDIEYEPLAPREHHNILFTRPHVNFALPNVFYTCEKDGNYAIFAEMPGRPLDLEDLSIRKTRSIILQLINAIADVAKLTKPCVSGVFDKAPPQKAFRECRVPPLHIVAKGYRQAICDFFKSRNFNVETCSLFNADVSAENIAIDGNGNFCGFRHWDTCAFAPSGYIMGWVIRHIDCWVRPLHDPADEIVTGGVSSLITSAAICAAMASRDQFDFSDIFFYEDIVRESAIGVDDYLDNDLDDLNDHQLEFRRFQLFNVDWTGRLGQEARAQRRRNDVPSSPRGTMHADHVAREVSEGMDG